MRHLPVAATVLSLGLLGLVFLTKPGGVAAGTALRMEIPELVDGAALVLEGSVLSAQALETPEGRIETEYLVRVDRTFEGEEQPFRSIRLPGGVLEDGRGMLLAGMPRIREGEDVLLFLSAGGSSGVRMPVGLAQGKFTVHTRLDGSKTLVREDAGVSLVGRDGELVHGEGRTLRDYAEVVAEIEAALATGESR